MLIFKKYTCFTKKCTFSPRFFPIGTASCTNLEVVLCTLQLFWDHALKTRCFVRTRENAPATSNLSKRTGGRIWTNFTTSVSATRYSGKLEVPMRIWGRPEMYLGEGLYSSTCRGPLQKCLAGTQCPIPDRCKKASWECLTGILCIMK